MRRHPDPTDAKHESLREYEDSGAQKECEEEYRDKKDEGDRVERIELDLLAHFMNQVR